MDIPSAQLQDKVFGTVWEQNYSVPELMGAIYKTFQKNCEITQTKTV